jgi:hypothetical protein
MNQLFDLTSVAQAMLNILLFAERTCRGMPKLPAVCFDNTLTQWSAFPATSHAWASRSVPKD